MLKFVFVTKASLDIRKTSLSTTGTGKTTWVIHLLSISPDCIAMPLPIPFSEVPLRCYSPVRVVTIWVPQRLSLPYQRAENAAVIWGIKALIPGGVQIL